MTRLLYWYFAKTRSLEYNSWKVFASSEGRWMAIEFILNFSSHKAKAPALTWIYVQQNKTTKTSNY